MARFLRAQPAKPRFGLPTFWGETRTAPTDPTAFYKLEETTGSTRQSEFGSYPLTDNGTVAQGTGKVNNCADFVAASSQFLNSTNAIFHPGNADYSFCGWVKFSNVATTQWVFGIDDTVLGREYLLGVSNLGANRLEFITFDAGGQESVVADDFGDLVNNTWYFFCCGYDSGLGKGFISVNGGYRNTVTVANGPTAGTADFYLSGRYLAAAHNYLTGSVDALGYWKGHALTRAEELYMYNYGAGLELTAASGASTPTSMLLLMGVG